MHVMYTLKVPQADGFADGTAPGVELQLRLPVRED